MLKNITLALVLSASVVAPVLADTAQQVQQLEQRIDNIGEQIKSEHQAKNYDRVKALRSERAELQKELRALKNQAREEGKAEKKAEARAAAERTWETYAPDKKLCTAIEYNRFDLVKKVMESTPPDLTQLVGECLFPLADATHRGHYEIAEYLLQKKSPLVQRMGPAKTLISALDLTAASREDRSRELDLLKRYGAGVSDAVEQSLPGAVTGTGDALSDTYLKEKFNYETDNMSLGGALTRALEKGHVNNIRWLLANGAKAEEVSLGKTALMFAIDSRELDKVKVLVDAGADVNRAGLSFQSPLKYAEEKRDKAGERRKADYEAIIAYLKSRGARYSDKERS